MILKTSLLRTDGGTQPRELINPQVVREYADDMLAGAAFPPVVAFYDGSDYWLADGFHRVAAYKTVDYSEIPVIVHQGTQRDAVLYSVSANGQHGLRRTNEDKRRAVMRLLNDAEWSAWSNVEIAKRCNVSEGFVRSLRIVRGDPAPERTYTTKHGTTATMQTANIGRKPESRPEHRPEPESKPRHEPEYQEEPEEMEEQPISSESADPENVITHVMEYIDGWFEEMTDTDKHMVVNGLIKRLRTYSIELNKSA